MKLLRIALSALAALAVSDGVSDGKTVAGNAPDLGICSLSDFSDDGRQLSSCLTAAEATLPEEASSGLEQAQTNSVFLAAENAVVSNEDDVLKKIAATNAGYKTLQADFSRHRTAKGKTVVSKGTLYFENGKRLAMIYSDPEGEKLISNGDYFRIGRGVATFKFDTSKNERMKAFSSILLNCVGGTPQAAAKANASKLTLTETAEDYVVTLDATETSPKTYSRIILNYRKSDCLLVRMQMEEKSRSSVYKIPVIHTGVTLEDKVFKD